MNTVEALTEEQRNVVDFLVRGDNVYVGGPGGSGKSHLIGTLIARFPAIAGHYRGGTPTVSVTALTGCAAQLLGHRSKTIHSWAGIGLGRGTVEELYAKIKKNRRSMKHWLGTSLLIIDEASMLSASLFELLNDLAKKIRNNTRFFGGIQLLLVGDFYQLPCISRDEPPRYPFESAAWHEGAFYCIELQTIHRQRDPGFQKVLNEARMGSLSAESCAILRSRENLDWRSNHIKPTLLYPRRLEVDMINQKNLETLKGERHMYMAKISVDHNKATFGFSTSNEAFQMSLNKMDNDSPYVLELELVVGAQVMMVANVDPEAGLVNGSRGVVVNFTEMGTPMVEFTNGERRNIIEHKWPVEDYEFAARTQIPLRLAWASTIHKSQGQSLDCILADLSTNNFATGQAYVALSRVRTVEGLFVHDFHPAAFKVDPRVKQFYSQMPRAVLADEERDRIRAAYGAPTLPPQKGKITVIKQDAPTENLKTAEPAAESVKAAEPAAENLKPAEPAAENLKPAEPAAEPAEPAEPLEPGAVAFGTMFLQAAAAEAEEAMKQKKERARKRARERARERAKAKKATDT